VARIASRVVPLARRADEALVGAATLPVVVEPVTQRRPRAQQRVVRDLDGVLVRGQQPPRHERVEHVVGDDLGDLGERCPPADVGGVVPERHETAEEPPRGRPARVVEVLVRLLRRPGHRLVDAAGGLVVLDADGAALAPEPGLPQRVGQQRQAAGLVHRGAQVTEEALDEGRLDGDTELPGG
jgi:hypothetical protein